MKFSTLKQLTSGADSNHKSLKTALNRLDTFSQTHPRLEHFYWWQVQNCLPPPANKNRLLNLTINDYSTNVYLQLPEIFFFWKLFLWIWEFGHIPLSSFTLKAESLGFLCTPSLYFDAATVSFQAGRVRRDLDMYNWCGLPEEEGEEKEEEAEGQRTGLPQTTGKDLGVVFFLLGGRKLEKCRIYKFVFGALLPSELPVCLCGNKSASPRCSQTVSAVQWMELLFALLEYLPTLRTT